MDPAASIVILTGAGISAESGLPTYRGAGGLWENHRFEDLASPRKFSRNPDLVHRFYNHRRAQLAEVQPNAAHLALAELERSWPGSFLLVTQNVDNLHERAGSSKVIHMHGELAKIRCVHCGLVSTWEGDVSRATPCPSCGKADSLRPDVVWFGEYPYGLDRIRERLKDCSLFVSIGTSGNVYPAAGLIGMVRPAAHTLEINLEASEVTSRFKEHRCGKATERVPEWVRELLAGVHP